MTVSQQAEDVSVGAPAAPAKRGPEEAVAPSQLFCPEAPRLIFRVRPGGLPESASAGPVRRIEYFALQGLGEEVRLLLEEAGCAYDSVYCWAGRPELTEDRKARSPSGQFPLYSGPELGEGVFLSQSRAILHHLGRTINDGAFMGEGSLEQAMCDVALETARDVRDKKSGLWEESHRAKMIEIATYLQEQLGWKDYFGGSRVLLADIVTFQTLEVIEGAKPGFLEANDLGTLKAFRDRFAARPRIASYLASPRRLPLTVNELGDPSRPWSLQGYSYLAPLDWAGMLSEAEEL